MAGAVLKTVGRCWLGFILAGGFLGQAPVATAAEAKQRMLRFEALTIDSGLSQSSVTAVALGPHGFLWLATLDGLNRYDGREFEIYRRDPNNPNTLSDSNLTALVSDGRYLWIGTEAGGLNRFDPDSGDFRHYSAGSEPDSSLAGNWIIALVLEEHRNLWISTLEGGIDRLELASGNITHLVSPSLGRERCGNNPLAMAVASDAIWIAAGRDGVCRIGRSDGQIQRFPVVDDNGHPDTAQAVAVDADGRVWVGAVQGIYRYQAGQGVRPALDVPLCPEDVDRCRIDVLKSDARRLWVAGNHGLASVESDGDVVRYPEESSAAGVSEDPVRSLFRDPSGIIWMGYYTRGVLKANPERPGFSHYGLASDRSRSLLDPVVFSLLDGGDGTVWAGTEQGLNRIDLETGEVRHWRASSRPDSPLPPGTIRLIHRNPDGTLTLGSGESGLLRLAPESGKLETEHHRPGDPDSLSSDQVYAYLRDRQGREWVGTFDGGLNLREPGSRRFRHWRRGDDADDLSDDNVYSLAEDADGAIWIGTSNGLNRLQPETGLVQRYHHEASRRDSLSNNGVGALLIDHLGRLWVGTDQGLSRFDQKTQRFHNVTHADGLANDFVYALAEDREGNIWLTTNHGISQFNPATGKIRNYDVDDGLQSNEFNIGAVARDRSGAILVGGINGFNRFIPEELHESAFQPPVEITRVKVMGREQLLSADDIGHRALDLDYRDSVLEVGFASLDYHNPKKNRYAYRLDGFDSDWNDAGTRNFALYTNLDPGRYLLRIRGSNSDGAWSEHEAVLAVVKAPPPWQSWPAYMGYILLFLTGLFLFVRSRQRSQAMALMAKMQLLHDEVSESREPQVVLERLLAGILGLIPCERAAIVVRQDEHLVRAQRPVDIHDFPLEWDAALLSELGENSRPLLVPKLQGHYAWVRPANGWEQSAALAMPLRTRQGTLGALLLYRRLGSFDDEAVSLVATLTAHSVFAVENAFLFEALQHLAVTDELTGIANRRRFFESAEHLHRLASRSRSGIAVLMIDIDHFKNLNDTYGHGFGDRVIREIARVCSAQLRDVDVFGRYGGEEFALTLMATPASTQQIAERLHGAARELPFTAPDGGLVHVTVSIGAAWGEADRVEFGDLLTQADIALYQAKHAGRDQVAFYQAERLNER